MADETPRPKPGSLKDRIKQFEASSTPPSGGPAPPPLRPKPGTLGQWKPKTLDPPSPSKATHDVGTSDDAARHAGGGMSADDAASSIRTGGTLKERMAALQGKGAFGPPATSNAPPLPSNDGKPRVWRTSPAPPISLKLEEEPSESRGATDDAHEPSATSPLSPKGEHAPAAESEAEAEGEPKTEEEDERERRAAIAARMARLGGARVGMPVGFGIASKGLPNKPAAPTKPKILTPGEEEADSTSVSPLPTSPSAADSEDHEPAKKTTLDTALAIPLPKSQGSLLSPSDVPSDSDATTSGKLVPPRSPDSMPIPALPKRAAGPRRKKSGKELKSTVSTESVSTLPLPSGETQSPPAVEAEQAKEDTEDISNREEAAEEVTVMETSASPGPVFPEEDQAINTEHKRSTDDPTAGLISVPPSEPATPPPPSPSVGVTENDEEDDSDVVRPNRRPTLDIASVDEGNNSPASGYKEGTNDLLTPKPRDEDDADEDEASRKQSIADRMAKLGGVNPFSPGGFESPMSSGGKDVDEPEVVEEPEAIGEEKGRNVGKEMQDTDDGGDKDVTDSAHESKTVPVLSSSAMLQDRDQSTVISTSVEDTPSREVDDPLEKIKGSASPTTERNGPETSFDEDEVDYPMMSPSGDFRDVSFSTDHGGDAEVAPHGAGVVGNTSKHGKEEILAHEERETAPASSSVSKHDQENCEPEDSVIKPNAPYTDEEDDDDMRSPRITRTVPPPPSRRPPSAHSSPASSTKNSPRNSQLTDVGDISPPRAQLVAALSRRAPLPPPHRSVSTSSISPPSSPPVFERESAPSPPSLRTLSNIEDEEECLDEKSIDTRSALNEEVRSPSPAPIKGTPLGGSRSASPSPAIRPAPPPVPSNRPPIPNIRRSIPPPPRHEAPPPSESPPPIPTSRPASGRASPMVVPSTPAMAIGRTLSKDDSRDDQAIIRKAAARPAIAPPRWNEVDLSISHEKEVIDDEEGDPVDPSFVGRRPSQASGRSIPGTLNRSSSRRNESPATPPRRNSLKPEVEQDQGEPGNPIGQDSEDPEATRRRTIAERMAKLGGIKFGMAPPVRAPPVHRPTQPEEESTTKDEELTRTIEGPREAEGEQTPEEAERARRAAIAARMAAMGGRGFGMYSTGTIPTSAPIVNKPPQPAPPSTKAPAIPPAAPPIPGSIPHTMPKGEVISDAAIRPPPPPPVLSATNSTSKGETSESEIELVSAEEEEVEMVEREEDELELVESPPAPPSRTARPPPHTSRPPPPIPVQNENVGFEEADGPPALPPGRRGPPVRAVPPPVSPPSEYVMLDEETIAISPPKRTHSHHRPGPSAEPAAPPSLESSGQWELPNVPSGSFDLSSHGANKPAPIVEQDQTWTKVEQEQAPLAQPSDSREPFTGPPPPSLSAERLAMLAHFMGPRVLQSAHHVYEKSKRFVIGDGSSTSFLSIVLSPIGASTNTLGHLVYAQSGGSIQKRLGDIMPGDVVALYEAHFKGHKGGLGLGGYSALWGAKEEPFLGIISEFDAKKSKIKAYAVNQHPNAYPTVDTPSYKLDDLKSGVVKVFRVAEGSG